MKWQTISFDWNQVRAFLVTAEEGSLSAAARALGQTQPTLSRQVSALEDDLGVILFERGTRRMFLTEAGVGLLEHVRAMGEAATRLSLTASGQSQKIEGLVRVTTTEPVATYHFPRILKRIQKVAPNLEIEVITSNEIQDLTMREADISIRHARPEQAELIAKCVKESRATICASRSFINDFGLPEKVSELGRYPFIGFHPLPRFMEHLQMMGLPLTSDNFKIITASGTAYIEYVRASLGLGILTETEATLFPDLLPVLHDEVSIPIPVWLVTHRELHTSKRIRLVYDILAEEIGEIF